MIGFEYTARDPHTGQKIKSRIDASSEAEATKMITSQGLAPLEIVPANGAGKTGGILSKFTNRITTKQKIVFSRQLSTLINAGLPLVQSLRNVESQTENKNFRVVISKIIANVEGGATLSDSMSKYPSVFNSVYINLVAAGEVSGNLDKALERIAFQQEKDAEIVSKIRGAMAYPAIVVLVMLLVVGFMIVKVLPQVKNIYSGMPGAQLPMLTRVLLAISDFTVKYWYIVLIILVFLGFLLTRYARTGPGKEVIDKVKMRAWPFGQLFMKVYMARFARTGTTLVASGIPLIKMLEVVSKSVGNIHIEHSINYATEKVKSGKSLADSIEGDPNFLTLVPNMLRIGEESGSLEAMLEKTADYYEKEVDNQIKTISTIIEPLLMVILGVVAFIIVAAVLLPIYGLAGKDLIH